MVCIACCFLRHRTNVASTPRPVKKTIPGIMVSQSCGLSVHQNNMNTDVEPERAPDEIASEQMDKCLEPCCYAEAKDEPIEQHESHQHWRYESHFTDTECCTNDTRRMCRSMLNRIRPRLHPRVASTASRPAKFSSFPPCGACRCTKLDTVERHAHSF